MKRALLVVAVIVLISGGCGRANNTSAGSSPTDATAAGPDHPGAHPDSSCEAFTERGRDAGHERDDARSFAYVTNADLGSISVFAIDAETGQLSLAETVPSQGPSPIYVEVHPTGRFLFVTDQANNTVLGVIPAPPSGRGIG